ncbi:PAS-domain containing protein [Microvirga massiliensis]|uniref:PAS-domain containing protein n=1 Tax=Microvirga massiliensis TaxID=1033741 RepID=UPI00164D424B|nr:PAS-domain containing protein [Microvirga massiliensis]
MLHPRRELDTLLNTVDYGILFLDANLNVRLGNRAYREIFGVPASLVESCPNARDLFEFCRARGVYPFRDRAWDAYVEMRLKAIRAGDIAPTELNLADGRILRYQCVAMPDGGRMLTYQDVTDQVRRERDLEAAEQRSRHFLEVAPFPLAVSRLADGIVLYANQRAAEIFGIPVDGIVGRPAPDFYAVPSDRRRVLEIIAEVGRVRDFEVPMRGRDGRLFWALTSAVAADWEGQRVLLTAFNDITDLKEREHQLLEAKRATDAAVRDLNAVLNTIDYGILFLDHELRTRLANRAYREIWKMPASFYDRPRTLGEDMEASRDQSLYSVSPAEWDRYVRDRIEEIKSGSIPPRELFLANGTTVQYQCIALPDGGRMLTYFETTDIKRREHELEEANRGKDAALRDLSALLEAIDYGVLFLDADLRIRLTNRAYREIWGIAAEFYTEPRRLADDLWRRWENGLYPLLQQDFEIYIGEREAAIRHATEPMRERLLPNGKVIQSRIIPLPDGGRMLSYLDISALKQIEYDLRDATARAEAASRAKSQFLASISHEVRTPLNAVLGYTEMVLDGLYGDVAARAREPLMRVEANGKHLLALINDVLDFSKIEAGELGLAEAPTSIRDIVQAVLAATEGLAESKGLTLVAELPDCLPLVQGDERRLTQVFLNLVGNAVKFTECGSIRIRVAAGASGICVDVQDTGIGIPEDEREQIFESFQQGSNAIPRAESGTGLGLAISKRIIEMHGGSISVTSEVGRGSVFSVTLPAGRRSREMVA